MAERPKYIIDRLIGTENVDLYRHRWIVPAPDAVLVIIHGYSEHAARYAHVSELFCKKKFNVVAFDQRGHGLSGGQRGYVRTFQNYVDDLEIVLQETRTTHPTLPLVLLGHSMGGLVATLYLVEHHHSTDLSAVLLTSPCLKLAMTSPVLEQIARLIKPFFPILKIPSKIIPYKLTHDREKTLAYIQDPLVFKTVTINWYFEMLEAQRKVFSHLCAVRTPIYFMHAGDDTLCSAQGTEMLFNQIESNDKKLRIWENLYHEILNEPNYPDIVADMLKWLKPYIKRPSEK